MVDTMMAWRVEHGFKPFWHTVNRLCVYPKLIDQIDTANKDHKQRMKTKQNKRRR